MKVVVEGNQVEIAFEALQSPLEEIFFGAAPLKAKVGGFTIPKRCLVPLAWERHQQAANKPRHFFTEYFLGVERGAEMPRKSLRRICARSCRFHQAVCLERNPSQIRRGGRKPTEPNLVYSFLVPFF